MPHASPIASATLRVLKIVDGTTVDGPGFRTSIYFAGCAHHCPECHNPQSWDADGGEPLTIAHILECVEQNDMPVTLTGGDPLFQLEPMLLLMRELKASNRPVWLYTGYTFEAILASPTLSRILPYVDVLVDGPFKIDQRNTEILFRGSENQRLIEVAPTLSTGHIHLWQPNW